MSMTEELINKRIGKTIAKTRKIAGFTQEEVAEHLGINKESFSRIERGLISSGIYKLYILADLFECGVDSFFIESSRRPTDQAKYISQMLMKNNSADRGVIVGVIEKLSKHMRKSSLNIHAESDADN